MNDDTNYKSPKNYSEMDNILARREFPRMGPRALGPRLIRITLHVRIIREGSAPYWVSLLLEHETYVSLLLEHEHETYG